MKFCCGAAKFDVGRECLVERHHIVGKTLMNISMNMAPQHLYRRVQSILILFEHPLMPFNFCI